MNYGIHGEPLKLLWETRNPETVLSRDVLQMSKVAKLVLLRHLFALAATLRARRISYTKMLG